MMQRERLGISYQDVRERRSDVVYSSVSAYGHDGPRGAHRGWEPVGQAVTGMQLRMGGGRPMMQPWAVCDYGTGLMGEFSVLLALFHQARTGEGQRVQASLSMTGTLEQTPFMYDYEGRAWDEPSGPDAKGTGPLQRLYEGRGGWFFLGAQGTDLPQLERVLGLDGLGAMDDPSLLSALQQRFAAATVADTVSRLVPEGVGAHALVGLEEVLEDPWVRTHHLTVIREHEGVGPVRMVGPSPRLSETPVRVTEPARPPGADGPAVLGELGFADTIEEMIDTGAIAVPS